MPKQEIFFTERNGNTLVEVLKSYDTVFAREAFEEMDEDSLSFLGKSLDLPTDGVAEEVGPEGLWEEVQEGARETWNTFSYFVVNKAVDGRSRNLFVSSDWPTAEAFAKHALAS